MLSFCPTLWAESAPANWHEQEQRFGEKDLIAFWAGSQTFIHQQNPYSIKNILYWERAVFPNIDPPQKFLNPPWSLPLLSLVFWTDFSTATNVWLILNILMLLGSAVLIFEIFNIKRSRGFLLGLSLLFQPAGFALAMGQLSILILFSSLLSYYFYQRKFYLLAGLSLIPISCKPHIVFIFLAWLGFILLKEKRIRTMAATALGFIGLILLSEFNLPGIHNYWLNSEQSSLTNRTSSFTSVIRDLVFESSGQIVSWPMIVWPLTGLLIFILLFSYRKINTDTDSIPLVLSLSLIFAPYAWLYDFVILLPLHILLCHAVLNYSRHNGISKFLLCMAPQILLVATPLLKNDLFLFIWFPLGFTIYYLIICCSFKMQKSC